MFSELDIPILVSEKLQQVLKSNGIDPAYYRPAYGDSAGLDLYYCGDEIIIYETMTYANEDLLAVPKVKRLGNGTPKHEVLLSTGLRIALPDNCVALLRERGSVVKSPLLARAGVIDPSYTGEIFVNLASLALAPEDRFTLRPGDKLPVQLLVVPFYSNFSPVTEAEFKELTKGAVRGEGKIGSSD